MSGHSKASGVAHSSGRKNKKTRLGLWLLVCAILLTALGYLAAGHADLGELFSPAGLWARLVRPILRTLIFISIGLLLGQLIESLGWTARLGQVVWPLLRWARLPGAAGAAFTSAFLSGVLANTLLYTSWQEGRLDKKSLIIGNLLCNSIPVFVLHMPTTLFIALSLTGTAGLWYMAMMFSAAVIRLLAVSTLSRAILPSCEVCELEQPDRKKSWREAWSDTWPKFKTRLARLVVVIIPVYLAVVLLAESGFFQWLRISMAGLVSSAFLPVEAMSLIVFSLMAEFTSGFAAAGALIQAGTLGVKHAVMALMIGNVVATPVRALRHQMPQYMGIYSPKFGLQVILINQIVRVGSVLLAVVLFALFYPA